jgi:hypothetical protein
MNGVIAAIILIPASLACQTPATRELPDGVVFEFANFADLFGSRLVAAFDSIPAVRYGFAPTRSQQTVGYIAQHLEAANYSLCGEFSTLKHSGTPKDASPDSVKALWPKDTLVARLDASLRFCDAALAATAHVNSAAAARNLLMFETDLAEHYSQISNYMRSLGLVPPSALPPRARMPIELPLPALRQYVGEYELAGGVNIEVTLRLRDATLLIRSTLGGPPQPVSPESASAFFIPGSDAQFTFTRDASGKVTGLIIHQYGRDRVARRL